MTIHDERGETGFSEVLTCWPKQDVSAIFKGNAGDENGEKADPEQSGQDWHHTSPAEREGTPGAIHTAPFTAHQEGAEGVA